MDFRLIFILILKTRRKRCIKEYCLLYPPSLRIPEACINVENMATLLFGRDAPFIAYFSNAAGSRMFTNLEVEVRDRVYCILKIMTWKTRVKRKKKTTERREND